LKQQLTLRLDADVIAWLRRQGKGYQTRANALLREAMLGDLNAKRRKQGGGARPSHPRRGGMAQTRAGRLRFFHEIASIAQKSCSTSTPREQ